jgi:hypothetical protein
MPTTNNQRYQKHLKTASKGLSSCGILYLTPETKDKFMSLCNTMDAPSAIQRRAMALEALLKCAEKS